MPDYINANVLTYVVKDFFQRHKLVNGVSVANVEDFKAIPSPQYPLVNIEPVEASYDGDMVSQGFLITVADIMHTGFRGEHAFRIQEAMGLIANDAIVYLQNQPDFDASTTVNVNRFEEEGSDRTAGVVFRINLIYHRDSSICVFDDILDITMPFCLNVEGRTVMFFTWVLHPFAEDYEVTFDGGETWETMIDGATYELGDGEYPEGTIGQRMKAGTSFTNDTIWNNVVVPEVEES